MKRREPTRGWCWIVVFLLMGAGVCSAGAQEAPKGMLLYRKPPGSYVEMYEYVAVRQISGHIVRVRLPNGKTVNFEAAGVVRLLAYPEPTLLGSQEEVLAGRENVREAMRLYPQVAKRLGNVENRWNNALAFVKERGPLASPPAPSTVAEPVAGPVAEQEPRQSELPAPAPPLPESSPEPPPVVANEPDSVRFADFTLEELTEEEAMQAADAAWEMAVEAILVKRPGRALAVCEAAVLRFGADAPLERMAQGLRAVKEAAGADVQTGGAALEALRLSVAQLAGLGCYDGATALERFGSETAQAVGQPWQAHPELDAMSSGVKEGRERFENARELFAQRRGNVGWEELQRALIAFPGMRPALALEREMEPRMADWRAQWAAIRALAHANRYAELGPKLDALEDSVIDFEGMKAVRDEWKTWGSLRERALRRARLFEETGQQKEALREYRSAGDTESVKRLAASSARAEEAAGRLDHAARLYREAGDESTAVLLEASYDMQRTDYARVKTLLQRGLLKEAITILERYGDTTSQRQIYLMATVELRQRGRTDEAGVMSQRARALRASLRDALHGFPTRRPPQQRSGAERQ